MNGVVQLYIDGNRVDLFDDESIDVTQKLKNTRDIAKVFTEFSKPFTIPASANNNKIFKHYYNTSVVGGFDARRRVDAVIEINNVPFKKGNVKLLGVDLKNNKAQGYRITFYGNTVKLKDILGDDKIESLSSLNSNINAVSSSAIKTKLQADISTTDIIAPLISRNYRLAYDSSFPTITTDTESENFYRNLAYDAGENTGVVWDDLKYAIRVDAIIQAISDRYEEIDFSDDFFNSSNPHYYNLFMWLHRDKERMGTQTPTSIVETDTDYTNMSEGADIFINENTSDLRAASIITETTSTSPYNVVFLREGSEIYRKDNIIGNNTISQNDLTNLADGVYNVVIESTFNITFTNIEVKLAEFISFIPFYQLVTAFKATSYNHSATENVIITQEVPEIKLIDLLTGLFKMFNLVAYFDENTNKLIVETLDDFYSGGTSYDITKYVDVEKTSVDVALPYKEISFKYEDTDTFLAVQHRELKNLEWSEEVYAEAERLDGDKYEIKVPFSVMKYERLFDGDTNSDTTIQVGWSVDEDRGAYKGKPLLFYPILQDDVVTPIAFVNDSGNTEELTSYIVPSNSVALSEYDSLDTLHFYNEFNEYSRTQGFTNTLFNKFYGDYISSIFNQANRRTKLTAYLPNIITSRLTLADRLDINGLRYKIDSVKTNITTGKSDLELINDYGASVFSDSLNESNPPTAPSNLVGVSINGGTAIDLSWDRSTDDESGVHYYTVYKDSVELKQVLHNSQSFEQSSPVKALTPSTSYDLGVSATDYAGNVSSTTTITVVTL